MFPDYEILSAYLDGQVTDEERARVERLLAEDDQARQVLEELREVSGAVSGLPRQALPDDFAKQIEASLEVRSRSEKTGTESVEKVDWCYLRRRFLSGRSLAWAATVLFVALGVNYFFPDDTRNVQQVASDRKSPTSVESSTAREESLSMFAMKAPPAEKKEGVAADDQMFTFDGSTEKLMQANESHDLEGKRFAKGQRIKCPESSKNPTLLAVGLVPMR